MSVSLYLEELPFHELIPIVKSCEVFVNARAKIVFVIVNCINILDMDWYGTVGGCLMQRSLKLNMQQYEGSVISREITACFEYYVPET